MSEGRPEPWLRGPMSGVPPLVMPVFFSFAQVREDLEKYAVGCTSEQVWRQINGASLGFHLRHMAGSVDRLMTYLSGGVLSVEQLGKLRAEAQGNEDGRALVAEVSAALEASEERLRRVDPQSLFEPRYVGRKRLPTTVLGLLVHLAEHTQRHLGQAITLAKMLRATS